MTEKKDLHELEEILLSRFKRFSSKDIEIIMQYDGGNITEEMNDEDDKSG